MNMEKKENLPNLKTENLLEDIFEDFEEGEEIKIKRSSGEIDGGWKVFSVNEKEGSLFLVKETEEGHLKKTISIQEARELNK